MKAVIVCASVSHGNTRRVADSMAEVLGAKVASPEQADPAELAAADFVGFGSGVFYSKLHPHLTDFVTELVLPLHGRDIDPSVFDALADDTQ